MTRGPWTRSRFPTLLAVLACCSCSPAVSLAETAMMAVEPLSPEAPGRARANVARSSRCPLLGRTDRLLGVIPGSPNT